jgi:hypothetical protein
MKLINNTKYQHNITTQNDIDNKTILFIKIV